VSEQVRKELKKLLADISKNKAVLEKILARVEKLQAAAEAAARHLQERQSMDKKHQPAPKGGAE
jgi:hypothetical protein